MGHSICKPVSKDFQEAKWSLETGDQVETGVLSEGLPARSNLHV